MPEKIPVALITGFLGSGKTTLLRHIAVSHPEWRMIFLVNEFADTGIDELTLQTTGRPTQSVVGGSLFCECKAGEFVRIMRDTVLSQHQSQSLDAVIIETSGIADPEAIGQLMSMHGLSDYFEIQRIVCVVAAKRFLSLLKNLPAVGAQVRTSDLVVINKIDLADSLCIEQVKSAIRKANPNARIVTCERCSIAFDLGRILGELPRHPLSTCDANPFCTESITWPKHRSIDTAKNWLATLPPSILRIKGTLETKEGRWLVERTVDSLEVRPIDRSGPDQLVLIAHDDDEADLTAACKSIHRETHPEPISYAMLACDVFEEELTHFGGETPPWTQVRYLEMGLHDQPAQLREQIQKILTEFEADPQIEAIALAYGRCGNGLIGVTAGRCPLILPQAHDCISILLGGVERHAAILKENPGTYFYSPGWVSGRRVPGPDREAYLRELYGERYPDDEEMIDDLVEADTETFAHHNCAAYVAITDNPAAREYCKGCARHLGWSHRELSGDSSFLEALVHARWNAPRFLHVPPGHTIDANSDGELYAKAPSVTLSDID